MKKPNIVYILADDMGYGDISCLNPECGYKTPNLDSLAQSGLCFTDAHAASAVCTPSRYGLLTGRYSWRSKMKSGVLGGYSTPLIEPGRETVADFLKQRGYKTACIGKWHLGMGLPIRDYNGEIDGNIPFDKHFDIDYKRPINPAPIHYGFDYYYGISASLDMPPYIYIENDRFTAQPDHLTENTGKEFWRKGPTAPDFEHSKVLPRLTDKLLEKIEEYRQEPFFLYFPMPAPHTPILPDKEFLGKSGISSYCDFVLMCDSMVGRVMKKLKDLDLEKDTILIFASDNGCAPAADIGEMLEKGHNPSYRFRGYKADIYEGGHRIPYIVRCPSISQKTGYCHHLVGLADLFATAAGLLGEDLPPTVGEDSLSQLPLWENPHCAPLRTELIGQSLNGSLALRRGSYKLCMCPGSGGWAYPAPGVDDVSVMPRFQLYDLSTDPGEQKNIIEERPHIAWEMGKALKDYVLSGRSTVGKPQKNNGAAVWDTVAWLEEIDSI